jgi:hypothetical protein
VAKVMPKSGIETNVSPEDFILPWLSFARVQWLLIKN